MQQNRLPAGSAALISIDLDNFHKVNARFGEETADRLLGLLARRWIDAMFYGGQLARTGGDEFVLLLTDSEKVEAQLKALRLTAGQPFILDGGSIAIAFTAGVVLFPIVEQVMQIQFCGRQTTHCFVPSRSKGRLAVSGC